MEFAVLMYQQDRLTLGQASNFAGVSQEAFQRVLGSRRIPVHYGLDDLEQDIATINQRHAR
jgi:predicted HTH domain antitoxin